MSDTDETDDEGGLLDSIRGQMRSRFGMSGECCEMEVQKRAPATDEDDAENGTEETTGDENKRIE